MKTPVPKKISDIDISLDTISESDPPVVNLRELQQLKNECKQPLYTSALMQWIFTVWRMESSSFNLSDDASEQECLMDFEQLSDSPVGTLLALLPNGKINHISRKKSSDFSMRYLESQKSWPDLMSSLPQTLFCVDAFPSRLPPQLYLDPEKRVLIDSVAYVDIFNGILKCLSNSGAAQSQLMKNEDAICGIIFELFKNTHDHARNGINGNVLSDSVRGIYTDFFSVENFQVGADVSVRHDVTTLDNYINLVVGDHYNEKLKTDKRISGFLEISVFDSGPGMAARFFGADISQLSSKDQYSHVIKCFGKGYSSTSSGKRGFGLWRVLTMLKSINGFVRLRTNKVHLAREFRALPGLGITKHGGGEEMPNERLYDWKRGLLSPISEYPSVEGTTLSVLIPLGVEE